MQRRDAIKKTILLAGGIALAPELLAKALAEPAPLLGALPAGRLAVLAEMADTILPETDTPGAKAAAVQDFIALAVEACFPPDQRTRFWAGLEAAERQCREQTGRSFEEADAAARTRLFEQLEAAAEGAPGFFQWLKELTLHGYFNSETGATQALAYDPVPGVWIPDMPVDENTKAWASYF